MTAHRAGAWSQVRVKLNKMSVGDCEAFVVEPGSDREIVQTANERWVRLLGWDFSTKSGVFVTKELNPVRLILVTRIK